MILGFQITQKIHENNHSVIYRALRLEDSCSVVLKMPSGPYATQRELARCRQEYDIISSLQAPGVIRAYSLEQQKNTTFLVLEDIGGKALNLWFENEQPTIAHFLELAIQASTALGQIHQHGIIHKDINPSNIIWNQESNRLKIIDFGISTKLSSEAAGIKGLSVLEGSLPYMSPEQTGRMNRHVDYRADFYSLGVTFYELLTGRLPFEGRDALELVHCHIAAQPRPPAELRADTPPILSQIIMKLLSKTAEERYQSAWGLRADLEACREQLQLGRTRITFPLGREDISGHFAIPQKLYGRSHEIRALVEAFERVSQGCSEISLLTGYSGIGKSSLVRELYKPITRSNAFFISGKFDLLQRATPYSAISATFSQLVKQLLTGTKEELLQWQERILSVLGPNGRILIDLIPELELIIGPQPEVEALGPMEAQNRLHLVLSSFIRVFCKRRHPLVMFLDDLQWADSATLRLLEPMMVDDELHYFLLIGAYRDNEVDAAHPLSTVITALEDKRVPVTTIPLQPLRLEDIIELLADTLHRPRASVGLLAELVLRRTGGNPFFVNEFLRMLHAEGFLRFDVALPGWHWDMAEIEATEVTENVAALLSAKLRKLPERIQKSLRLAACIGNSFDLKTISIIADQPAQETFECLMEAVREGYIHPISEPELVPVEGHEPQLLIREYKFIHDRVQQAAYGLIPSDQSKAIHLGIGHLLLAKLSPAEREERLFELVDHLNLGCSLLDALPAGEGVNPVELARLDLAAGKRAKQAAAYSAAAQYLGIGIELVGAAWEEHPELVLALHVEAADAEYCLGKFERSQALIDAALPRASSAAIKAHLYQISIIQYTNQGKHDGAFRIAREALQLLGQPLPGPGETATALEQELADIQGIIGDRAIESLTDAPEMTDDTYKAAVEIMSGLVPTAFQADAALFQLLAARMVRLQLEHGQTVAGLFGYSIYGLLLGTRFQDYRRGYRFGELAWSLAGRLRSATAKCRAGEVMIAHLYPWAKPLQGFYPISIEAFEAGLQSGELQFAAFILMDRLINQFYQGITLQRILDDSGSFLQFSKNNKNVVVSNTIAGFRSAAAYLSNVQAQDEGFELENDVDYIARCRQEASFFALGLYYVLKCQILYLFHDYERALHAAREAEALLEYIPGMISVAHLNFYHSLCLAELFTGSSEEEQRDSWRALEAHQAQMKIWVEHCPENFRHMFLLVAAEMARITGEDFAAVELYAQAIEAADAGGFRQDVAIANELTARFWLAKGQKRYALSHLRDAHYSYILWGARRKQDRLEAQYAELLMSGWPGSRESPHPREKDGMALRSVSSTSVTEQLDLASVIKASQALSGEIALDKLLARLIEIVIENAGAQHGALILKRKDRLMIEACGTLGEREVQVLQSLPLEGAGSPMVSPAIVNYVLRSGETVVLHDAAQEGPFVRDAYVIAHQPRSVLCMPLINQGNVNGVVYLENNLSPQAFTPERVELLKLLSSQMAISLDSSLLYSNLQRATLDLERLLYSTAHDLKEPLRAIQSFSELLMRRYGPQIDAKGSDYLARIVKAGQRLGSLLDAIRTVSEIRRSDGPRQSVSGMLLVQDAERRLRPLIEKTRASVLIASDLPTLMVDRRWAVEAIYRLFKNALQYTREDMQPEIAIAAYEGSEGVGLVIQDRGPGIPSEYMEKVFELFRRVVGREASGTGAGLAIVRQIAMKHGGNAWLSAREGGGLEAYITFGR